MKKVLVIILILFLFGCTTYKISSIDTSPVESKDGSYKYFQLDVRTGEGVGGEIYLNKEHAENIIQISKEFGIDAKIIGYCKQSHKKQLTIQSEFGEFQYS